MICLLLLLLPSVIVCILMFLVSYSVHRSQVLDEGVGWGYGNFEDFIREFNKRQWEKDGTYKKSFFGVGDRHGLDHIHASIIKFDGKGMILDPISYLFFKIWEHQNRRSKALFVKDLWKGTHAN